MTTTQQRYTAQEQKEIAGTILQQLGGRKFLAMTGARDLYALDGNGGLQLSFRGSTRANKLVIKVDPDDTYTFELWKIRGVEMKKVYECDGVYDDMLQSIFTSETGLDCTLGTMGR